MLRRFGAHFGANTYSWCDFTSFMSNLRASPKLNPNARKVERHSGWRSLQEGAGFSYTCAVARVACILAKRMSL